MKNSALFFAAVLSAVILSGCADTSQPIAANDRIHGAIGVGVTNENLSRVIPERPYTSAPPSTSSGPVLTPSSSPY